MEEAVIGFCDDAGELLDWGIVLVDGVGGASVTVTLVGVAAFVGACIGTTIVCTLLRSSQTIHCVNRIHG